MGVYEDLGVRRIINAHNDMTNLGGSLMPPEVVQAWVAASRSFVNMHELHWAAGQEAARLVGAEMGLVTAGAAAAMVTAAAACIVQRNNLTDPEEMRARLPHSEGLANELPLPRSHRNDYAQAFQVAGGRLVEFGTAAGFSDADLAGAIGDKTAAVCFILSSGRTGTQQDVGSLGRVVEHRPPPRPAGDRRCRRASCRRGGTSPRSWPPTWTSSVSAAARISTAPTIPVSCSASGRCWRSPTNASSARTTRWYGR